MADEPTQSDADRDGTPAGLEHLPGVEEATSWIGFKLDDANGRSSGRVEGLFVDSRDGAPTWIAVKTGRLRGHSAVPFEFAAAGIGHVWVPYSKEQIRSSPEVDPTSGLDHALELALCEHYGIPAGSRRRGALDGRADEAQTSDPLREAPAGS